MIHSTTSGRVAGFRFASGTLVLVCVLLTGIFGLLASSASARPYSVHLCRDGSWASHLSAPFNNDAWVLAGDCRVSPLSNSVNLWLDASSEVTEEVAWTFPQYTGLERPDLRISEIRVTLGGSGGSEDGVTQGIRLCGATCGPLITRTPPPPGFEDDMSEETLTFEDGSDQVPANAFYLQFVGKCESAPCGPTQPLKISLLELTYTDLNPPLATIALENEIPSPVSLKLGWQNKSMIFEWGAADSGSGVRMASLRKGAGGTGGEAHLANTCDYGPLNSWFCPTATGGKVKLDFSDTTKWQEGQNWFYIQATDRVGLNSTRTDGQNVLVSVDRKPPTPASFAVAGANESKWVAEQRPKFEWVNINETTPIGFGPDARSGVAAVSLDFAPLSTGQPDPAPEVIEKPNISAVETEFPARGRWRVSMRTIDGAGNRSDEEWLEIGFDDQPPGTPTIEPIDWVGETDLLDRKAFGWRPPTSLEGSSGICGYGVSADRLPDSAAPEQPNITGAPDEASLPVVDGEGDHFLHLRAVSCAGVPGPTTHEKFSVDMTEPRSQANSESGAWTNASAPLTLSASDELSGVRGIHVSVDNAPHVEHLSEETTPELNEGMHLIDYFAGDVAGNRSQRKSMHVGVDRSAPTGWFEPPDPDRPTSIAAFVDDIHSGIADATVEYRSAGSTDDWIPLGGEPIRSAGHTAAQLRVRFPDASAGVGSFEFRVVARDRVGNVSSFSNRFDGTTAGIVTPVRERPKISLEFAQRGARNCTRARNGCRKTRSIRSLTVPFGKGARVAGRLTDASGKPLTRRNVLIDIKRPSADRFTLKTVTTDGEGRFAARVPRGVNRRVIARFKGEELKLPRETEVRLFTASKLTLRAERKRVRAGRPFRVSGRLFTGGEPISELGLPMSVRVARPNFSVPARVGADGRFVAELSGLDFSRPTLVRLQAILPQQAGWPYAGGASREVVVTIVP